MAPPPVFWIVATAAAGASLWSWRDALHAYFWNDDFVWLYLLHDRPLVEVLLTPLGGHTLVARNAVFAVLDRLAGLDPAPYFATVLLTHALNVVLLARLVWLLTGSVALAGLSALAWGTCPTASETLTWYSVYGQVAATTCILAAACRLCAGRHARLPAGRDLAVVALWLGVANLFFGTGMAVALALPVVVASLFPDALRDRRTRARVLLVAGAVIAMHTGLHAIAASVYAVPPVHGDSMQWLVHGAGAAARTFVALVRVGTASLVLGAWWHPSSAFSAASWIALAVVGAGSIALLTAAPLAARRGAAAFLVLALAVYALVALARGPTLIGMLHQTADQVGATQRYHYTAQALLAVALSLALAPATARLPAGARRALIGLAATVLVAGAIVRPIPLPLHDATRRAVATVLERVRADVRATPSGEPVVVENRRIAELGWMPNTNVALPGLAALFVVAFPSDAIDGRPVRFVERDAATRRRYATPPSRLARLLIPPGATR